MLAGVLAGMLGTMAMTLSSGTEMELAGRPASAAPGSVLVWPLRFAGIRVEGRALMATAVWAHWVIGTAWGVAWWALLTQVGLGILPAALAYFGLVWGGAVVAMRVTGTAPWPWQWGHIRYNLLDWGHHAAYVAGTAGGWVLIERIAA